MPRTFRTSWMNLRRREFRLADLVGVDVPRVLRLVREARDAVMRRAGFTMHLFG